VKIKYERIIIVLTEFYFFLYGKNEISHMNQPYETRGWFVFYGSTARESLNIHMNMRQKE
jgi:hypothetical protein